MASFNITVDSTAVQARFERMPQSVYRAVKKAITAQTLMLEQRVKEKLSDQVLHVRTGRLRRSIHYTLIDDGSEIAGRVYSSADVDYGRIHEYGGTINHPGGTAYWQDSDGNIRFVSNAFAAKVQSGEFPRTRAHTIVMPERSFMRSSLAEQAPQVREAIAAAVREGSAS